MRHEYQRLLFARLLYLIFLFKKPKYDRTYKLNTTGFILYIKLNDIQLLNLKLLTNDELKALRKDLKFV